MINAVVKEAEFIISSTIENLDASGLPIGECERTEGRYSGYFHVFGDEYLITYTEEAEGKRILSEIKYSASAVTVCRTGAIESRLVFTEGEAHASLYKIPPYTFDAEVRTRRIREALNENGGSLELHYNMKIGGADKSVRMKIWISTNSKRD